MRRFWIVPAVIVVAVGLATAAGPATAEGNGARPTASSCGSLVSKYQKLSASGINFSDPTALTRLFKQAATEVRFLASNGPRALRSAFKDLVGVYNRLARINPTDPTALSQLSILQTPRYAADLHKIALYFAQQCHFTIPTTAVGSTP